MIDDAVRTWRASVDVRSPLLGPIHERREAVKATYEAARVEHRVHLGDPADDTATPAVDPDNLRIVAERLHALGTDVETLRGTLHAREQELEYTALGIVWQRTQRHLQAIRATVRHLDEDSPRTAGWAPVRTPSPTAATPGTTTGSPTTNATGAESADVQPAGSGTRQPRPASTPTETPTPPHPKSAFDHWTVIAPAPAPPPEPERGRRHAGNRRHARPRRPVRTRDRIQDRDTFYTRDYKALQSAWKTANAPRIPPETPDQHVRDLRDQGDRHSAVARAAAKLAASPQRDVEREALHELRVTAERHARDLYRRADALDPRRRPRPQTARSPFVLRFRHQRLVADTLLAGVEDAENHARQGVAGRDVRANEHLHATGPEHERLVRDIRAEHAAAHQVMRDVWDRSWWHQADSGQIAAVWQRAVEWSAHHDVVAAQVLQHVRGRVRQYHDIELPTPPVYGVNLNAAIDRGHPAPAEGPAARWTYTVRDPLLHTRLLDQGEHTALERDTPHTVGRRVLADLADRGADPDVLARAVVEIVPADRPDAKPVVVTAAQVRDIARDQANRDRAERDLAQDAAALKSSLDHRWWENARPVEIGWMWRAVQDWEKSGPARNDALDFLTDRIQATFGVTLDRNTPAVLVTERIREHAPAPLDPTGAPERAVAARALRLFDLANGIEARVAAGDTPGGDAPAQLQQARSHRLRARHLAALASDPDEARHLLGAARPPTVDIDRFHHDIAAEYRRSWGRTLTDDESAQLRSILEQGTANNGTNTTEDTRAPAATPLDPPRTNVTTPTKDTGQPPPTAREPAPRERPLRTGEPASRDSEPKAKPMPAAASTDPALQQRTPEPQAARPGRDRGTIARIRVALNAAEDRDAAPHGRPGPPHLKNPTGAVIWDLAETSVRGLSQ
ncbi:hypothetical protein [Embleya sp. NPDC001921]